MRAAEPPGMRVLLAVHAFPPRSLAGVEVYTARLARALSALGHEVLVLSAVHDLGAEPGSLRRRSFEGVEVAEIVNLHHRGTLLSTYRDPDVDRAAASVIREWRPGVLHLQHLLNLSTGLIGEAREVGARVVMTLHDYWLSCPRDGLRMRQDLGLCSALDHGVCADCLAGSPYLLPSLQRGMAAAARGAGIGGALHRLQRAAPAATERGLRLLRRLSPPVKGLREAMDRRAGDLRRDLGGVEAFLAPTRFARDRALELGLEAERVRVASLGAVRGPLLPSRPGPRRRLAYLGTLAAHKGVHVLIEAFRRLADSSLTLEVFGDEAVHPSYAASLRAQAGGDPRIRFRGRFPEGGQDRVLAAVDAVAVPSLWWENSPLVVLEALAAGLPVVASATGGVPELAEAGGSLLLVPPGDVAALAEALRNLCAEDGSRLAAPARVKTVVEGARELVSLYEALRPAAATAGDRDRTALA